jgi:acyl-CoA synthetase (AMP-forming)/AMP-acid ligase II
MAGGVFLVVNPQTKADKLQFILADSGARILLTDGHLAKEFMPVLPQASALVAILASGKLPDGWPIEAFDAVLAATEDRGVAQDVIPLDLAALIYTSGSTGNPK